MRYFEGVATQLPKCPFWTLRLIDDLPPQTESYPGHRQGFVGSFPWWWLGSGRRADAGGLLGKTT
jgi:hypothetical protein